MSGTSDRIGSTSPTQQRTRPLFKNRPVWAKAETLGSSQLATAAGEDSFSRSKEVYAREERLKSQAKGNEQNQGKKIAKDANTRSPVAKTEIRTPKRRRISSTDEEDNECNGDGAGGKNKSEAIKFALSTANGASKGSSLQSPSSRPISPTSTRPQPKKCNQEPIIIDMSDEDDEIPQAPPALSSPTTPHRSLSDRHLFRKDPDPAASAIDDEIVPLDEDPEYARLAAESHARRQEEEKRKLNRATSMINGITDSTGDSHAASQSQITNQTTTNPMTAPTPQPLQPTYSLSQPVLPTPIPDPIIHLLVHCPLRGTKPLILKIRLTTKLKAVRENWILQQDLEALPETTRSEIFLTWRRRRVFDFTTCKSLGIGVGPTGEVVLAATSGRFGGVGIDAGMDGPFEDGWENEEGNAQICMQAVTQAYLDEEAKREKQTDEDKRRTVQAAIVGQTGHINTMQSADSANKADIRIILKAKNMEDYKLKVRPTTKFSQIIRIYRAHRKIAEELTTTLMFEGDRLDEDEDVQATDVADMDVVEVHIKS